MRGVGRAPGGAAVGASERVPVGLEDVPVRGRSGGHLEVLQWARENGCPWDEETCSARLREATWRCFSGRVRTGARGTRRRANTRRGEATWRCCSGRVRTGARGTRRTCENAAGGGHLEVLKWARENGCPFTWRCCSGRVRTGVRGTSSRGHAPRTGRPYLVEHGCPVPRGALSTASCGCSSEEGNGRSIDDPSIPTAPALSHPSRPLASLSIVRPLKESAVASRAPLARRPGAGEKHASAVRTGFLHRPHLTRLTVPLHLGGCCRRNTLPRLDSFLRRSCNSFRSSLARF